VLAIIFAWIGVAGIVIALQLMRRGWRRATIMAVLLTAAIYVAWIIAFALEVHDITDERGSRNRRASSQVAYSSNRYPTPQTLTM
jgi:hypothetical protein